MKHSSWEPRFILGLTGAALVLSIVTMTAFRMKNLQAQVTKSFSSTTAELEAIADSYEDYRATYFSNNTPCEFVKREAVTRNGQNLATQDSTAILQILWDRYNCGPLPFPRIELPDRSATDGNKNTTQPVEVPETVLVPATQPETTPAVEDPSGQVYPGPTTDAPVAAEPVPVIEPLVTTPETTQTIIMLQQQVDAQTQQIQQQQTQIDQLTQQLLEVLRATANTSASSEAQSSDSSEGSSSSSEFVQAPVNCVTPPPITVNEPNQNYSQECDSRNIGGAGGTTGQGCAMNSLCVYSNGRGWMPWNWGTNHQCICRPPRST